MSGDVNGVLVVKVGGATLEDPHASPRLLDAIAGLSRRGGGSGECGGGVVLVHGGGRAVDRQLARLGMETRRHEGLRITPPDQIEQIAGVLAGSENKRVVGELLARGVRAVGMSLGDGNAVPTRTMRATGVDLGHVGELVPTGAGEVATSAAGPNLLRLLCANAFVPVVCSIGIEVSHNGGAGQAPYSRLLNVNADDAAAGVARAIQASGGTVDALVLLTDVPGVLDANKQRIDSLDGATIESLVRESVVSGGMLVKVRAAHATAMALGTPVVIASGTDAASLEALGRGTPTGTRILPH